MASLVNVHRADPQPKTLREILLPFVLIAAGERNVKTLQNVANYDLTPGMLYQKEKYLAYNGTSGELTVRQILRGLGATAQAHLDIINGQTNEDPHRQAGTLDVIIDEKYLTFSILSSHARTRPDQTWPQAPFRLQDTDRTRIVPVFQS
jgi:hypothetical protein